MLVVSDILCCDEKLPMFVELHNGRTGLWFSRLVMWLCQKSSARDFTCASPTARRLARSRIILARSASTNVTSGSREWRARRKPSVWRTEAGAPGRRGARGYSAMGTQTCSSRWEELEGESCGSNDSNSHLFTSIGLKMCLCARKK